MHITIGMKRYLYIMTILLLSVTGYAQKISIRAPKHVDVGEQFQVEYVINSQDVNHFRAGKTSDAVYLLGGPYTSEQSSWQMVNGHTSSSSTVTVTYVYQAAKKGNVTISPAQATIGGKTIQSAPVHITVSGHASQAPASNNSYSRYDSRTHASHPSSSVSENELFIKTIVSKKSCRVQEPILLTYKVYTQVPLTDLNERMPDLKGFHSQKIKLDHPEVPHNETLNGRNYRVYTWSQYVLYPQMSGSLKIPDITFQGVVTFENRDIDPFEAFFNGGSGLVEVKKDIKAPAVTVQVSPLPQAPAGFSGGVGKFTISSQLAKEEVTAGNPLTLRVVVSGTGNLKLIKQPEVAFPKEFEKYDAKVTDKTTLTVNGVEGNMVYDILAVPRKEGTYTIPPVKLVYFDTSANTYKTVQTQPQIVIVAKGDGTESDAGDFTATKGQDIRPIKSGKAEIHAVDDYFFGSALYLIVLFLLMVTFGGLLYMFRHQALQNANIGMVRGKKASKVANKRLRQAEKLMEQGEQGQFYDEIMRTLWGYVGDKFNMSVEGLSRENIREHLQAHDVNEETINQFIASVDECEFERYAPGDAKGNMSRTFETAKSMIMRIENAMKTLMVFVMVAGSLIFADTAHAITKNNADAEFAKGNYQQAIVDYQELLKQGVSAEIYYNMGNAYYRLDKITQAVLAYERALLLSPSDDDIRFNLQMARSKTIDKITPASEMFFVTWYRSLVNMMSVDGWAYTAILSMILVLVLVLVYLFTEKIWKRKIGFFGGIFFLILFVFANVFAYQQRCELTERNGAIVVVPSVPVKETPATNSTSLFYLHEGTRVEITDRSLNQWRGIRLADGREGWLTSNQIEQI